MDSSPCDSQLNSRGKARLLMWQPPKKKTLPKKGIMESVNGLKLTETTLHAHIVHAENGTSPPSDVDGFMSSVEGIRCKREGDATLSMPGLSDTFEYNLKDLKHHQHEKLRRCTTTTWRQR